MKSKKNARIIQRPKRVIINPRILSRRIWKKCYSTIYIVSRSLGIIIPFMIGTILEKLFFFFLVYKILYDYIRFFVVCSDGISKNQPTLTYSTKQKGVERYTKNKIKKTFSKSEMYMHQYNLNSKVYVLYVTRNHFCLFLILAM